MGVHFKIGLLNRQEIEDEIQRLVDLLDGYDAPSEDLEPDDDKATDDDACDVQPDHTLLPALPRYGVDQSLGPINERQAYRDWQRGLMEGGR